MCIIWFTCKNSVISQVHIKSEVFVCVYFYKQRSHHWLSPEQAKLSTGYFCQQECLALDAQIWDRTGLEHGVMGPRSQAGYQLTLHRGYNCVLGRQMPPGHLTVSWSQGKPKCEWSSMIHQVHWDTHQMHMPHHFGFLLHGHKVRITRPRRKGLVGVEKETLLGAMALFSRSSTLALLSQSLTVIWNHALHWGSNLFQNTWSHNILTDTYLHLSTVGLLVNFI